VSTSHTSLNNQMHVKISEKLCVALSYSFSFFSYGSSDTFNKISIFFNLEISIHVLSKRSSLRAPASFE